MDKKEYMKIWRAENKEKIKASRKLYYSQNKEKELAKMKKWQEDNKEYYTKYLKNRNKNYRTKHKEKLKEYANNYYEANKEELKQQVRDYRANNVKKITALSAKRRAAKLQRTPKWADLKAISEFYKNCPEGYHVDHIIPLRAKNVSGLHVLENLQYLPAIENLKKSNNF